MASILWLHSMRGRVLALAALIGCDANAVIPPSASLGGHAAGAPAVAGSGAGGNSLVSAGTSGLAQPESVGFAATVQPFIDKACNCHESSPILMAPFSLKPADAYGQLVNMPSQQLPSMVRVKPGSIEQSYLWHKISGTQLQVGGSGMIMPSTIPLSAEEKLIFERWINAGAPP